MKMSVGKGVQVELGGLRFDVMRREFYDDEGANVDGGTSIEIYGDVEGKSTQLVRIDCFRKDPHYHVPAEKVEPRHLDSAQIGDPLDWAYAQTRDHLPELIREAGYEKLALRVDTSALRGGWERVKRAVANAPEPTKTHTIG